MRTTCTTVIPRDDVKQINTCGDRPCGTQGIELGVFDISLASNCLQITHCLYPKG